MKLHLLRHAKTEPIAKSGKDFDRKLLPKGIAQAKAMHFYFAQQEIQVNDIFCSDAKRTRETAGLVFSKNGSIKINYMEELYLAEAADLLSFITSLKTNEDLLIIGHNNGLSDLASYLTGQFVDLQTCELIIIQFDLENWTYISKDLGTIVQQYHPVV